MIIPALPAPLLYALLSVNPNAISSLPAAAASTSLSRQEIPRPAASIVNATVSCREGEFQNPESDIQDVACGDYYECAGGAEAERLGPDGEGGEEAVWTAECFECKIRATVGQSEWLCLYGDVIRDWVADRPII